MNKVLASNNCDYKSILPTAGSVCYTLEDDVHRGEKTSTLETSFKYKHIWKRVKAKIITSLRIEKMIRTSRTLGISDRVQREFSVQTVEIEKYLKSRESALKEEIGNEAIKKQPFLIAHPNNRTRKYWDYYLGILLIYSCIITPYSLAFINPVPYDPLFVIDLISDLSFLFDVFFNFCTAYYDKEGQIHFERKLIMKRYLYSWFAIDLIAGFPSELIDIFVGTGYSNRYNSIAKLAKIRNMTRVLKISRAAKLIKYSDHNKVLTYLQNLLSLSHNFRRFLTVIIGILLALHVMACFFYFTSIYDDFSPDTWVVRYGIEDQTDAFKYVTSFYFALTTLTTIGYGDITPKTYLEKFLVMLWMVAAVYFLSFVISSLSSMLMQNDIKKGILDHKFSMLDKFSDEASLKKKLKAKMKVEIRNRIMRSVPSSSIKEELVQDLSIGIKLEIAETMFGGIIKTFPFFLKKDRIFIANVVPLLDPQIFMSNEIIYSQGDDAECIYFLGRGRVHFVFDEDNKPFKVLSIGNYFGDIEVTRSIKREFSVVSARESFLLAISSRLITKLRLEYPPIWSEITKSAILNELNLIKSLAEMRVLLRINFAGRIKKFNPKEVKVAIGEEINLIKLEKKTNNEISPELAIMMELKKEMASTRDTLARIEARMEKLHRKKHRQNKQELPHVRELPPLKEGPLILK